MPTRSEEQHLDGEEEQQGAKKNGQGERAKAPPGNKNHQNKKAAEIVAGTLRGACEEAANKGKEKEEGCGRKGEQGGKSDAWNSSPPEPKCG